MAMKFEKRLIILSGDRGAKGSLTLEKNAYGFFAALNIFNLPDLVNGEYAVGIKNKQHFFSRRVGSSGRIATRIQLDDTDLNNIHCVVFDSVNERPLLYGTNDNVRLWQANMMDGFRTKRAVAIALGGNNEKAFEYSKRPKEIESFFLDILPKDEYSDNAVAAVNYYPSNMSIEVAYSKRDEDVSQFQNPVDRAVENCVNLNNLGDLNENGDEPLKSEDMTEVQGGIIEENDGAVFGEEPKPWELQRRYINRYFLNATVLNKENKCDVEKKNFEKDTAVEAGKVNSVGFNDSEETLEEKRFLKHVHAAKPVVEAQKIKRFATLEKARDGERNVVLNAHNEKASVASVDKNDKSDEEVAAAIPSPSSYVAERALNKNIAYVFYEQVKSQLDEIFKVNPVYEPLEKLMPDTKWVRVDYDNDGRFYVVGLIGSKPDYLCYGVPASYSPEPPKELDGYCQWLPTEPENPEGEGFWLMFQDALSGESVR